MLLFSTILSINDKLTKDEFIKLVIEWNQGSPHKSNVISNIDWNGERNVKYEEGNLWLEIEEYRNENIIAVRYEKKDEDGIVWDTDYVMNFTTRKMAIRLDRSYLAESISTSGNFSTPHFITLLIEHGYLEDDYDLPILKCPVTIREDNIEQLVEVINGKRYELPVVYVSKTFQNEDPVDTGWLASRLKGVAHVLVQETKDSNQKIRALCDDKNEYNGAIGIYCPSQANSYKRFLYRSYPGGDKQLLEKVISVVISYSNAQMIDPLYTWQGVSYALLRDRLENQKKERIKAEVARREALYEVLMLRGQRESVKQEAIEKAKEEANTILDCFEDDLTRLQEQIDELTHDNEKLQYENQGLKVKLDTMQEQPVLVMGTEMEFYPGEIKDLILSSLNTYLQSVGQRTRRYDVIQDLIEANDYQEISKQRANEVKRLLSSYNGMTGKIKKGLEDVGFIIEHEGDHYKAIYYGDDRYIAVYGATPSDVKAGKNNVSNTIKKVF